MTRAAFDAALCAVRDWHAALPAFADFVAWPDETPYVAQPATPLPVLDHIINDPGDAEPVSDGLRTAIINVAPYLHWQLAYTEAEVGRDFHNRFGYCELIGPVGHFHWPEGRICISYWGSGLDYPRHEHAADELYTVVSGRALFMSDGDPDAVLGAGGTRLHQSWQPHAMRTADAPVLTVIAWRNDLDGLPRISG